jgi:hypothetical protein
MVFIQHKLQTLLAIAWPQTLALNFKVSQFLNGNHKIELFFGGSPAQIRPLLVFVSGCVRNLPTAALFGSLCRDDFDIPPAWKNIKTCKQTADPRDTDGDSNLIETKLQNARVHMYSCMLHRMNQSWGGA